MNYQPEFFDRLGARIDLWKYVSLMEIPGYLRIAEEFIDGVRISTVWLGINHNWAPGGIPPLIFETMIFPECEHCERTPTETAALAAHDQAVEHVRCGDYAAELVSKDSEQAQ